jgi:hypothetical protein
MGEPMTRVLYEQFLETRNVFMREVQGIYMCLVNVFDAHMRFVLAVREG